MRQPCDGSISVGWRSWQLCKCAANLQQLWMLHMPEAWVRQEGDATPWSATGPAWAKRDEGLMLLSLFREELVPDLCKAVVEANMLVGMPEHRSVRALASLYEPP